MAVTNYFTVDGQLFGEETDGTFRGYVPDALGSVMATTTSGNSAQNTYRYKPNGEQLAKTGVAEDPKFMWVGTVGYRCFEAQPIIYVRRRHYALTANWTCVDDFWPKEKPYAYGTGNPVNGSDPSGAFWCTSIQDYGRDCKLFDFRWLIRWSVSQPVGPDTFIVQKVDQRFTGEPCEYALTPIDDVPASTYWEAWEVTLAGVHGGYASDPVNPTDDWRMIDPGILDCSKLHIKIEGEACLFRYTPIRWRKGGASGSGTLPSTIFEPDFWRFRNSSDCIKRTLYYRLACCDYVECGCARKPNEYAWRLTGCGK